MSKTAFMFPGQGSQCAGMGADFYEACPKARAVYDMASELIGIDMKKLCFEENEHLDQTEFTQIALLTTGMAMEQSIRACGLTPDVTAGLSLGEYNAIVSAGGMEMADAMKVVRRRGILMEEAVPAGEGAMAAVLVVVLLLLSWSLFGDKIVAKITPADDGNTPGVQDDVNTPDDSNTNTDDPNANNGDTTDPNTGDEPNANDPANGSDTTATNPGTTTTPSTPTVDASALSIKTNVGTTLPMDGFGNFDCTIKSSETIRLSVSGTDAAATWAVADASVLSISADGLITPAKGGTTTVTATVGGAVLTITVRIK